MNALRRLFIAIFSGLLMLIPTKLHAEDGKFWVFVGTYTGKLSKGIYRCELDAATGKLSAPEVAAEIPAPSFLAIHPNHKFLYCVSEQGGKDGGKVTAFSIDPKTGALTQLNQRSSGGSGPCHIVVDHLGKTVLAANYGSGSCASYPLEADGKLGEAGSVIQHKGSSVDKGRQEGPHAHSINVDKNNKFAFCADLGLDKVLIYKLNADKGTLTPNDPPFYETEPGAGPRHFAFHPSGKYAFVINEMKQTLTSMKYDPEKGALTKIESYSTLPGEPVKGNSTAEVVVHPSGKWVYGSNRGHDSIVCFSIDEKTGELKPVGWQNKGIKVPRNFAIDPTGKFMIVANQAGNSAVLFKINQSTGELEPTDQKIEVGSPVCIRYMAKP
jgi:6-phosphogluconolactonase